MACDGGWNRVVDLADVPVLVTATEGRRQRALDTLVDGAADHPASATARISYVEPAPSVPDRPPDQIAQDIRMWEGPDGTVAIDDAGVGVRLTAAAAEIGGDDPLLELRYRRFFHLAATHLLA
ncbi:MAG: hypothetical protein ABR564_05920, partial [Candidatus Dormibacteria bacterium]